MTALQPNTIDYIGGIPISWFREIDVACDHFFMRRGLPLTESSFRDLIHDECQARLAEKMRNAVGKLM